MCKACAWPLRKSLQKRMRKKFENTHCLAYIYTNFPHFENGKKNCNCKIVSFVRLAHFGRQKKSAHRHLAACTQFPVWVCRWQILLLLLFFTSRRQMPSWKEDAFWVHTMHLKKTYMKLLRSLSIVIQPSSPDANPLDFYFWSALACRAVGAVSCA